MPRSERNVADDLNLDVVGGHDYNDQCHKFLMPGSPGIVDVQRAGALLALLSPPEIAENRPHFSGIKPSFVLDAQKVEKLYKDELSYQRALLDASYNVTESDRYHRVVNRVRAFDIVQVANATGQYIWEQRQESEHQYYEALPPEEKFKAVLALNRYRSEFRDRLLIKIVDELEQAGTSFNEPIVSEIYDSLFSSHLQAYLGEKIYNASLESNPTLRGDFERHLTLLLATHPVSSVRRERALKRIADGDRSTGLSSIVRTWDHYDRLTTLLEEERRNRSHTVGGLLVSGAIGIIEEVLSEPESGVSADEKADTLLWLVGVRGKSRLVRCVELVTKREPAEMMLEASRLSDDERRQLIRKCLAGPGGILKDMVVTKVALLARKINTEIDVQALRAGLQHINRRRDSFSRLKGVYDKLAGHLEERIPERHDRREEIERLFSLLTSDRDFLQMIIGGPQIDVIRQMSARAVEECQATAYLGKYWSLAEITDEEARGAADLASFGKMPMLWRERIEPGMLFQVHRGRNVAPELYVSLSTWNEAQVGRVPTHRERSYAFLKTSIEDHETFVKFVDMIDGSKRRYDEITSLEALIRDGSLRMCYFNKDTQLWESVEKLLMSVGESWSAYERRKG